MNRVEDSPRKPFQSDTTTDTSSVASLILIAPCDSARSVDPSLSRDERPILMTARTQVAEWPYRTNDVKSRARLAAHFSLTAPDDILLSQMFVKLFADRQLSVDPKVISYLVGRMERSSEEVVALVELLDKMSLSRGRAITRAIAAEALVIRSER